MAGSRSIGGVFAELTLRDIKFRKGIENARKSLNTFASRGLAVASVGTVALATALAAGSKKAMSLAGDLDDISVNTGIAIADVMKLRKGFELGGAGAEKMAPSIAKMQKTLADAAKSSDKNVFDSLGLSAQKLMKMSPAEQFETIGDAIMRIENPAKRTAAAMGVFGKSGASLINVFGQMKDAGTVLGRMPEVMQKYGASMAKMDDLINELPNKGQQFFVGFTAGIAGQLLPELEKTANFDFTKMGENVGEAISQGFVAIKYDLMWELIKLHSEKWLIGFAGDLYTTFSTAGQMLAKVMKQEVGPELPKFGDFLTEKLVEFGGSDEAKARWQKIKNDRVQQRALDSGYSPLTGGAPEPTFETMMAEVEIPEWKNEALAAKGAEIAEFMKTLQSAVVKGQTAAAWNPEAMGPPKPPPRQESPYDFKQAEVNDYQRRGLSLGGTGAEVTQNKQLEALNKIVAYLYRPKTDLTPTW